MMTKVDWKEKRRVGSSNAVKMSVSRNTCRLERNDYPNFGKNSYVFSSMLT